MSVITSPFPQITTPPQALAEVLVNEGLGALSHQAVYGYAYQTSSGLTWGYYGGRWGGFSISAGTLTLTASETNDIVVEIATGAISVGVGTDSAWDDADFLRVYRIVTGASAVTSGQDHRAGPAGVHGGTGGTGSGFTSPTTTKGDLIVRGASTDSRQGVGADGQILKADSSQTLGVKWVDDVWSQTVAISDLATSLATGTGEGYFDMPFAATLTEVIATVQTSSASGLPQFDVKKNGTTVFSTNVTIDASETSSLTAATAAVISVTSFAKGDRVTFDIVAAGTGTKGAQITCLFKKP